MMARTRGVSHTRADYGFKLTSLWGRHSAVSETVEARKGRIGCVESRPRAGGR
jgi:hypothetical protein